MRHARDPEGRVRNGGLLIKASEHLRRSLETACRISEALRQIDRIDEFHAALMGEIAAESPALAERVVLRLAQLTARFGAG